jgi:hypothetical protein
MAIHQYGKEQSKDDSKLQINTMDSNKASGKVDKDHKPLD